MILHEGVTHGRPRRHSHSALNVCLPADKKVWTHQRTRDGNLSHQSVATSSLPRKVDLVQREQLITCARVQLGLSSGGEPPPQPYGNTHTRGTNNYRGPDLCSKSVFFLEDRRAALSALISKQ